MLKAIAFDLWETLITNTPSISAEQKRLRERRTREILLSRGYATAAERIEAAFHSQWHRCQELYWSQDRDVPCRRQVEHFLEELEIDPRTLDDETLSALEDAYAGAAVDVPPAVVEGAPEALREIKARGFGVGLISNTGRTPGYALRRILENLDLAPSIDVMVFSNEHGHCKPRTSIFEELRRALRVDYSEMAFVGDNPYVDVHGAQRCGMRGILFVPKDRGLAVAPAVDHGMEIVPDATIRDLRQLIEVVA